MNVSRSDSRFKSLKTRLRAIRFLKSRRSAVVHHELMLRLAKEIDALRLSKSATASDMEMVNVMPADSPSV